MNRIRETLDEAVQRRIVSQAQASSVLGRIRPEPAYPGDLRHVDLGHRGGLRGPRGQAERVPPSGRGGPSRRHTGHQHLLLLRQAAGRGRLQARACSGAALLLSPGQEPPGRGRAGPVHIAGVDGAGPAALQERIGKTPIASADAPGFVVNRFFVPWINEAARMLGEKRGRRSPTIEAAARESFAIGMGPFELMNADRDRHRLPRRGQPGPRARPLLRPGRGSSARHDGRNRAFDLSRERRIRRGSPRSANACKGSCSTSPRSS